MAQRSSGLEKLNNPILKISSNKELIHIESGKLFAFLEDMQNYRSLMPDRITDWQAAKDTCRFTIPGMTDIGMKIEQSSRFDKVRIVSDGKNPFTFQLDFQVSEIGQEQQVYIDFDADIPAMLAMMAKNPLQNLINHMVGSLKEKLGN